MRIDLQSAWFKQEQDKLQREMVLIIMCGKAGDLTDLIDRGADVNAPDPLSEQKVYPLAIAIQENKTEMVYTLLKNAANPLHRHETAQGTIAMSELAQRHKNPLIIDMVTNAEKKARIKQNPSPKNKGPGT